MVILRFQSGGCFYRVVIVYNLTMERCEGFSGVKYLPTQLYCIVMQNLLLSVIYIFLYIVYIYDRYACIYCVVQTALYTKMSIA